MSGSRGEANFVWKCKSCKVHVYSPYECELGTDTLIQRESSATIKAAPLAYEQASPPKRQKILEFDCRGLEFTEFKPEVCESPLCGQIRSFGKSRLLIGCSFQGEWLATGLESGTKFTAIDLTDGEWYEYDDKTSEEVSIKDLKWEIRRNQTIQAELMM